MVDESPGLLPALAAGLAIPARSLTLNRYILIIGLWVAGGCAKGRLVVIMLSCAPGLWLPGMADYGSSDGFFAIRASGSNPIIEDIGFETGDF